jgi:hypothetical protein
MLAVDIEYSLIVCTFRKSDLIPLDFPTLIPYLCHSTMQYVIRCTVFFDLCKPAPAFNRRKFIVAPAAPPSPAVVLAFSEAKAGFVIYRQLLKSLF